MASQTSEPRTRSKGLSYSQLSTFLTCEQKWEIQYIERERFVGSEAMFIGSLMHALLEHSYKRGKKLGNRSINAIYVKMVEDEYAEATFDMGRAFARVVALYDRYCAYYPDDFTATEVVAVEDERYDGVISGVADLLYSLDGSLCLREHKTKGRLELMPADFQRDFYSRLWPEIDLVEYNMLNTYDYKNEPNDLSKVFGRSPSFSTQDNQERLDYTIQSALQRMDEIRNGRVPLPAFMYNTCKFCDHKASCPAQMGLPIGRR